MPSARAISRCSAISAWVRSSALSLGFSQRSRQPPGMPPTGTTSRGAAGRTDAAALAGRGCENLDCRHQRFALTGGELQRQLAITDVERYLLDQCGQRAGLGDDIKILKHDHALAGHREDPLLIGTPWARGNPPGRLDEVQAHQIGAVAVHRDGVGEALLLARAGAGTLRQVERIVGGSRDLQTGTPRHGGTPGKIPVGVPLGPTLLRASRTRRPIPTASLVTCASLVRRLLLVRLAGVRRHTECAIERFRLRPALAGRAGAVCRRLPRGLLA